MQKLSRHKPDDPIFAAIARCRAAEAEHDKSCNGEPSCSESPEYKIWCDVQTVACNKAVKAIRAFCKTTPTTIAGIAAAVSFVKEYGEENRNLLATYAQNGGGPDCTLPFLTSLCAAFERLGLAHTVEA